MSVGSHDYVEVLIKALPIDYNHDNLSIHRIVEGMHHHYRGLRLRVATIYHSGMSLLISYRIRLESEEKWLIEIVLFAKVHISRVCYIRTSLWWIASWKWTDHKNSKRNPRNVWLVYYLAHCESSCSMVE